METLLNEIFTLDKQKNENRVEGFAKENDIRRLLDAVRNSNLFF